MEHELRIQYRLIGELNPYAHNARTHSAAQIRQLARSIEAFGFINPVVVDEIGMIVAGHARVLAAQRLGLERVPTVRIDHLSQAEKRAYILADNKLSENSGWNPDLLRVELDYLARVDVNFDVDLTGFSAPEIDLLFSEAEEIRSDEPPPPLPTPEQVITREGDLWVLEPHRILCGDCRDSAVVDRLMANARAGVAITDPPYNVAVPGHVCGKGKVQHENFAMASGEMSSEVFEAFLTSALGELARVSDDGAVHFVFMDWRHLPELLGAGRAVYSDLLNLCVWAKTNGGMGSLYRSQHELVLVFKNGTARHRNNVELGSHGRHRTNVWSYAGVNSFGADRDATLAAHPTVKPIKLVADAILDVSRRGDVVLDGFLGSGTTILAAEQTGRIGYGIELDPRYVDVALKRWSDATGEMPVLADTGQPLFEVANERREATVCEE